MALHNKDKKENRVMVVGVEMIKIGGFSKKNAMQAVPDSSQVDLPSSIYIYQGD